MIFFYSLNKTMLANTFTNKFTNIYLFFTFWLIILTLFHKYVYKYVNLLYLSFVTLIIGSYMSYINPREFTFVLFNESYTLRGIEKTIIIDLFAHLLIFVYIYSLYYKYYTPFRVDIALLLSISILLIYIFSINIKNLYKANYYELFSIGVVANLLYLIIFDNR